jgi:hypothetical protein
MKSLQEQYIASLTSKEKQAYEIAKSHLKSLFNLENTNGYLQWLENQKKTSR